MSSPIQNRWTNFLAVSEVLDLDNLYETRIENDSSGKILYVGLSQLARAPTDEPIWFVFKLSYDGNGFLDYKQLPVNGAVFTYVWDDRATYFV
jgi:hypothetical protein